MRVLITGGTGFIGKKLAAALLREGVIVLDDSASRPVEQVTLFDAFPGEGVPQDPKVELVTGDITDRGTLERLAAEVDLVWHLAAVVSSAAEADFDLGYLGSPGARCRLAMGVLRVGNEPENATL